MVHMTVTVTLDQVLTHTQLCVMCRWHVWLNVSWIRAVANSTEVTVLSSDSQPLLVESFSELTGFWDSVRVFRCDGAGEYPGQTR
jgi:hypothetical protein